MDYKQKYEQAILRMNKWVEGSEIIEPKEVAEFIFPELKKSEDEKIKREILELVSISGNGSQFEEIKDWLEKQVEQKPAWSEEDEKMINDIIKNLDEGEWLDIFQIDWLKSIKGRIKGEQ